MKPRAVIAALGLLALAVPVIADGERGGPLAVGEVRRVLALPDLNFPEGIAIDDEGTIYVGNRCITGEASMTSEIIKIGVDGRCSLFATLPPAHPDTPGLLGLAVDRDGDVYAALASFDGNSGVYRISRGGRRAVRLAGSEGIVFPNALIFDDLGNLYATDSLLGAIWRSGPDEEFELWVQDELLEPDPEDPFGIPLVGANGIAFFPKPTPRLYVANNERGLVVLVPINPDATAGVPEVVAGDPENPFTLLGTIDGIAVDKNGDVHGVIAGYAVLGAAPLIRIDPDTGAVTPTVTEPDQVAKFDVPLSLAFGTRPPDHTSVFVTNGALRFDDLIPPGPGPGVVQVGVGVPGFRR